MFVVNLMMK